MTPYANEEDAKANKRRYNKLPEVKERQRKWHSERRRKIKENETSDERGLRLAENRAYRLKWLYGITKEEYEQMIEEQDGKCALCGKEFVYERLHNFEPCIDHNHETGQIRGILHRRCNIGIGQFNDDVDKLEEAVDYLKRYE